MNTNRRGFHRLTDCKRRFTVDIAGRTLQLWSLNLSLGGVYFAINRGSDAVAAIQIATPLNLRLHHDSRVEDTAAQVVYAHQTGFGAAFVDPSEAFTELLREVIAEYRKQRYRPSRKLD